MPHEFYVLDSKLAAQIILTTEILSNAAMESAEAETELILTGTKKRDLFIYNTE
jgi:hypothetical protein